MGFDPFRSANVRVLTYLDLMRQFLTSDAIKPADLDPAVQRCLAVRDFCVGYHIALERINRERKGSALADLLNFRRQTHETGWSFSALFLMQNGKVVYKLWCRNRPPSSATACPDFRAAPFLPGGGAGPVIRL
jgi:hypothetical protein